MVCKLIGAIAICLVACSVGSGQTYGLGLPVDQPQVVRQVSVQTFGLGNLRRRSVVVQPVPTVTSVQSQPVYSVPVVVSQPVVRQVAQPRWRMVRQRQCTPSGCQDIWVRVYQ
jgi:hypothetical protein